MGAFRNAIGCCMGLFREQHFNVFTADLTPEVPRNVRFWFCLEVLKTS